jgi:hypothetical protein
VREGHARSGNRGPGRQKSYRRPVVSHCGPLQQGWTSAAFLRRGAASGLRCRLPRTAPRMTIARISPEPNLVSLISISINWFRDPCCQQQDQRAAFFCWMTFVSWWMKLEGS